MLDRERVHEVFAEAVALTGAQRAEFLGIACAGDAVLRAEIESLLAAVERGPEFMAAPTAAQPVAAERVGAQIGPYRLQEEIGEGGFGTVYMAEQTHPLRRSVALKIIKLGMDTRAVIARFEAERQALALMEHANIARVLDAGATDSGRPYFVMELVRGDPITVYCDRNSLTIADRLQLFAQVCHAVQHAHSKGVIHRDIKPTNILVTTQDGRPHAKVIDFGIAKATQHRLTEKTLFTGFRQLVGTPEYMSPEQAEGSLDIDTRTDVYGLGVLLYELLTGSTPFDGKALRSAAYAEMQRIIREVEPPKPSTRLSQSGTLQAVAAHRRIEPGRLSALVRGDLDWIAMKALDKDRARRYDTPSSLAADIERYAAGEPVMAVPASAGYRLRKFVGRHRAAVAAGAIILATLVLGITGTSLGFLGARAAEWQARAERDSAAIVRDFLSRTFEGLSPQVALGRDTALLGNLMDKATARIDAGEMKGNLEAEHELRLVIAGVYTDIARYNDASRVLQPLRDAPSLPAGQRLRLDLLSGRIGLMMSDWDAAERSLHAVADPPSTGDHARAEALSMLGEVALNRGSLDPSIDLHTRAVAAARAVSPPDDELIVTCLSRLGGALSFWGRDAEAQPVLDEAMALLSRPEWADSPLLVDALNARSMLLSVTNPSDSVAGMRKAVETARRIFPSPHPKIALSLHNLAAALYYSEDYEQALATSLEALEMRRRLFGDESPETTESLAATGSMLCRLGRYDEAIQYTSQAIAAYSKRAPDGSYDEALGHMMLAESLHGLGRVDQAIAEESRALEGLRKFGGSDDDKSPACADYLATYLQEAGRLEEAAATLRDLIQRLLAQAGPDLLDISGLQARLALILLDLRTPQAAKEAESALRESLKIRTDALPDGHPRVWLRYNTMSLLGAALIARGTDESLAADQRLAKLHEAEPLVLNGYNGMKDDPNVPPPAAIGADRKHDALLRIVAVYEALDRAEPGHGHADAAAEWRRRDDVPIPNDGK